jgi:hypothetical protein
MINEGIVLDYYSELITADRIEFLTGKPKSKAAIISCINEMKTADSIHHKIEVSKALREGPFFAIVIIGKLSPISGRRSPIDSCRR